MSGFRKISGKSWTSFGKWSNCFLTKPTVWSLFMDFVRAKPLKWPPWYQKAWWGHPPWNPFKENLSAPKAPKKNFDQRWGVGSSPPPPMQALAKIPPLKVLPPDSLRFSWFWKRLKQLKRLDQKKSTNLSHSLKERQLSCDGQNWHFWHILDTFCPTSSPFY